MQIVEQQPSTSQAQFVPAMYMPCIEGLKMDWKSVMACFTGS